MAQALVLDVLILLNDFEAQALSLPRLGAGRHALGRPITQW